MSEVKQNSFTIDHEDNIIDVDDRWNDFADENLGGLARREHVVNRPLWTFIHGETTRHIYEQLIAQVRSGATLRFKFRCDSPTMKRFLKMVMSPLPNGHVRFETLVAKPPEPRDPNETLPTERAKPLITCSWCKKVTSGDDVWYEIQDAVELLRIFETDPMLSHGICLGCYDSVVRELAGD